MKSDYFYKLGHQQQKKILSYSLYELIIKQCHHIDYFFVIAHYILGKKKRKKNFDNFQIVDNGIYSTVDEVDIERKKSFRK